SVGMTLGKTSRDRGKPPRRVLSEAAWTHGYSVSLDPPSGLAVTLPGPPLTVAFAGASSGAWRVERFETVSGSPLAHTSHLEVVEDALTASSLEGASWVLRGVTSNQRYVTRAEHDALVTRQEPLGRPESTRA